MITSVGMRCVGGMWLVCGRREMHEGFWWGNLKVGGRL
jgi:hypothetical protein